MFVVQVWAQLHAPPRAQLLCLSATVGNAEELAAWMGQASARPQQGLRAGFAPGFCARFLRSAERRSRPRRRRCTAPPRRWCPPLALCR